MFNSITDEDERGQVGIGTLIVFIAMVLVAAIAAGVLINTAGVLQTQASNTGSETQEQVANQIEVLHASGSVDKDTDSIESVDMTLMKSAGSNEIDLRSMTVQYTSDSVDETLTYGPEANASNFETAELHGGNEGTSLTTKDDRVEMTLNTSLLESGEGEGTITSDGTGVTGASIDTAYDGNDIVFDVEEGSEDALDTAVDIVIEDSDDNTLTTESSVEDGDQITLPAGDFSDGDTLTISTSGGSSSADAEVTYDEPSGLPSGSSATVALVDQSGAQFTYGISVPSTFGTSDVVEV